MGLGYQGLLQVPGLYFLPMQLEQMCGNFQLTSVQNAQLLI